MLVLQYFRKCTQYPRGPLCGFQCHPKYLLLCEPFCDFSMGIFYQYLLSKLGDF